MISVVILTYNRLERLKKLLHALQGQSYKDFETLIIDTGSTDGTQDWLRQFESPYLRLIEFSDAQGGFAEARNLGVKEAKGDIIAFIDDDCLPPLDWLQKIEQRMRNLDAVGGVALPPAELQFPYWWSSAMNWLVGLTPIDEIQQEPQPAIYPSTSNLAICRQIALEEPFQELKKPFGARKNELYVYWVGREDAELWWRLRTKGYHLAIDPDIFVHHYISPARLKLSYLIQRAYRDGYVFFLRQQQKGYLRLALYQLFDIVNRIVRRSRRQKKLLPAIIVETLWSVRQAGYISAFLQQEKAYLKILKTGLECLVDYIFATTKTLARKILVTSYRIKKPTRSITLSTASNVLLINSGYVGDFIIIQPAIRALRRALPNSKFIFLCNEPGRQLYELLDSPLPVDEIYCLPPDKNQQRELITHLLGKFKFSATIFFYYHNARCQEFFFHRLASPTCSFSSDVGFERQLWYDLLDIKVHKDFNQNEILNHFKLAETLTGTPLRHFIEPYQVFVSYPLQEKYKNLFSKESIIIGINTGSALPQKRWLPEYWAELVHLLQQEFSHPQIVFIGDKQEQKAVAELLLKINQRKGIFNLAGETPHLLELAALISNFDLLITTDSGPKHLAFALRVPTVTLYGDSDERRWGALWDEELHLAVRVAPYDLTNDELCDFPPNHRIRLIKPHLVAEAVTKLTRHLNLA